MEGGVRIRPRPKAPGRPGRPVRSQRRKPRPASASPALTLLRLCCLAEVSRQRRSEGSGPPTACADAGPSSRLTLLSAGWMTRHRAKHGRPLIDAPCRPTTCARPRPLAGLNDRLQALGARRAAQGRLVAGQAGGSRCLRLGSMLDFPRLRPPTSTASDRTSTDVPQTFECSSSSWLDTAQTIAVSAGQIDPFNRRLQTRSEWRS
jgi:hypothetical protein